MSLIFPSFSSKSESFWTVSINETETIDWLKQSVVSFPKQLMASNLNMHGIIIGTGITC